MKIRSISVLVITLFITPGCIKYYQVSKTETPQAKTIEQPQQLVKENLRTVKLYDQFSTIAIFDALWLSDDVRTHFAKRYTTKRGKDQQTTDAFIRRQLEENRHWISFYILADIRSSVHNVLSEKNSAWTLQLSADNKHPLEVVSVKEVELEPEYQALFGTHANPFKSIYLVRFSAQGSDGEDFYLTKANSMKLTFTSPTKQGFAQWQVPADGKKAATSTAAAKNKITTAREKIGEDFYWG